MAKVCETALRVVLVCVIVVGSAAHNLHLPPPYRPSINHAPLKPLHRHQEPAPTPAPALEPSNPTLNIDQYSQEPMPGPVSGEIIDHPPPEPVPGPEPGEIVDHPPLEPVPGPEPGEIIDCPPCPSPEPMPPMPPKHLSSFFGSFNSRPHATGAPTHV